MQSQYGWIVALLLGACFSGCAGTGDAWHPDAGINTDREEKEEFDESETNRGEGSGHSVLASYAISTSLPAPVAVDLAKNALNEEPSEDPWVSLSRLSLALRYPLRGEGPATYWQQRISDVRVSLDELLIQNGGAREIEVKTGKTRLDSAEFWPRRVKALEKPIENMGSGHSSAFGELAFAFPSSTETFLSTLTATSLAAGSFAAQDPSPGESEDALEIRPSDQPGSEKDWEIILAPSALFANIVGESAIGQAGSADVDVGFSDILEVLKIGAMGHVEARIGRWGLMTDFAYMKLADDINTPRGRVVDAEVEQLELETYLFYRFPMERGWVDAYVGVRYWNIGLDVELTGPLTTISSDRREEWVDPVVGGRFSFSLSEDWSLGIGADIGGFGANSDFSWNVLGTVGWKVTDWFTLAAGYRALGVDYDNDESGRGFFSYDTITHGPLLGFVFTI